MVPPLRYVLCVILFYCTDYTWYYICSAWFLDIIISTCLNCIKWTILLLHRCPQVYYTWNKKSWNRRKQGTNVDGFPGVKEAHVIGRVYTISPRQAECFYL